MDGDPRDGVIGIIVAVATIVVVGVVLPIIYIIESLLFS